VSTLENYTFDELSIGQTASYSKTLTEEVIALFAAVSGDVNPVHMDEAFAATTMFKGRIAHGMWTGALISAAIAMELPGPGSIYLGQTLSFRAPVRLGDTITITMEVTEKKADKGFVTLACTAVNQDGTVVVKGSAEVMAPKEKLKIPRPELPKVSIG
jgi:acyl dehydratase